MGHHYTHLLNLWGGRVADETFGITLLLVNFNISPLVISGFLLIYANKKKSERIKLLATKSRKSTVTSYCVISLEILQKSPSLAVHQKHLGNLAKIQIPRPTPGDQESVGPGQGPGTYIST